MSVTLHLPDGGTIYANILEWRLTNNPGLRPAWGKYCEHVDNENGEYWELGVGPRDTLEIICEYCARSRGIIWQELVVKFKWR